MTNGVRYAPRMPRESITFDFLSDAKYATKTVKANAVTIVAISGITAVATSVVRDPYMRVPYRRSIPAHMITSAKYLSFSEKENADPMIITETKKPIPSRTV